ncbi:Xaa-Pro peptidase family protein [Actinomadura sp. NPDC048955]|uniref:M24 family metallopeptidase n=1 Tax=Actinomadura sp. NPDC048955 TaxID=3158228 RepID=UPI00340729FA
MVYLNFDVAGEACRGRSEKLCAELPAGSVAVAGSAANVRWLTGLAGVPHTYYGRGALNVLVGAGSACHVVAPASELGWICEVYDRRLVHPYGRFVYRGDQSLLGGPTAAEGGLTAAEAILNALHELPSTGRLVHDGHISGDVLNVVSDARPDVSLVADPAAFVRARRVKDGYEIDCLRRANLICEAALEAALEAARPGMTEREMLRVLRRVMVEHDAHPLLSALGFSERGALVDMPVSDRALRSGDVIRFDIGCSVEGYNADMSRTAVFGAVDPELADLHAALVAAEQAAIDAVRPGVQAGTIFEVAVHTARSTGVPDFDRTHCGHGIGLEIYEPPGVTRGSTDLVQPGMTMCVELPYYLLGRAGLQIEDAIVVTETSAERLGGLPQELLTAG